MQVKKMTFLRGQAEFWFRHKSLIFIFMVSGSNVFETCVSEFKLESVFNCGSLKITL